MAEVENQDTGIVQVTPENMVKVVQDLVTAVPMILDEIKKLQSTTVKKSSGLFGGKRVETAIKDTTTGVIYPSKAAMGKALAKEFSGDTTDNFVYYKIMAKAAAGRFVDATQVEAEAAWAKQQSELQKAVDAANKELEKKVVPPTPATPAQTPQTGKGKGK